MEVSPHIPAPIFAGQETRAIDENHRVTVPSRWRCESVRELYAVPDPRQPLLILLTPAEMDKVRITIENDLSISAAERRVFLRQFFSQATPCPMDKQGRLVLPSSHCQKYGLENEVVLVGGGARIEVWSSEQWNATMEREADVFARVSDRIGL